MVSRAFLHIMPLNIITLENAYFSTENTYLCTNLSLVVSDLVYYYYLLYHFCLCLYLKMA